MSKLFKLILLTTLILSTAAATQEITNPGAFSNDSNFGYEISGSYDKIAISSPREDMSGAFGDGQIGAVRVYKYNSTEWVLEQTITRNDFARNDGFGTKVALSGNILAILNPKADTPQGADFGAVYIYAFNGTSWNYQTRVYAEDISAANTFGSSLSLDGPYLAVGASYDDDAGVDSGAVYIFEMISSNNWALQQKVVGSDTDDYDYFGTALSLSGTKLVAGTTQEKAYVFEYIIASSSWQEQQKLTPTGSGDNYARTLLLKDNYLLVAAGREDTSNGSDGGRVYIYKDTGVSWDLEAVLEHPAANTKDSFGSSLAISPQKDLILIGIDDEDDGAKDAGAAILFRYTAGSWKYDRKYTLAEQNSNDFFGIGVLTSINAVVSAYGKDFGTDFDNGVVMIYDHRLPAISPLSPLIDDDYIHPSDSIQVLITDLTDTIDTDSLSMNLTESGLAKTYSTQFIATDNGYLLLVTPDSDFAQKQEITIEIEIANSAGLANYYNRTYQVLPLNYRRVMPQDSVYSMQFAATLAYDDNWLAAGVASGDTPTENGIGLVYMYQKNGSSWQEKQIISPAALDTTKSFGKAIAISGTRMIITGYKGTTGGDINYYLYEYDGNEWVYQFRFPVNGKKPATGPDVEVAIEGDRVLLTSPADLNSPDNGGVYLFEYDGVSWNQAPIFSHPDATKFSKSVAISSSNVGVRLVMGSAFDNIDTPTDKKGAVYIYKWDEVSSNWELEKRIYPDDAVDSHYFGQSVAIEEDLLVVGTRKQKIYIYEYSSVSGDWFLTETISSSDVGFGENVRLSNGNILTAANMARNDNNDVVGKAFVYTKDLGTWILDAVYEPIDVNANLLYFGSNLAMDGLNVFVAAANDAYASMEFIGSVYNLKYHPQVRLRSSLPSGSNVSPTASVFAKMEGYYDITPGSIVVKINDIDISSSCSILVSGKYATINYTPDYDFIPDKEYNVSILVEDSENIEKEFRYNYQIEDLDIPTGSMISYFVESGASPNLEVNATEAVKHKVFRIETGIESGIILDQDMIRSIYALDPDLDISDLLIESLGGGECSTQMSILVPTSSVLYRIVTPGNKLKLEFIYADDHFIRVKPTGETEFKIVNDYDGIELPGLSAAYQSKYSDYSIDASANILSFTIDDFCQYGLVGVGLVSINENEAVDESGSYLAEIQVLAENSEGVYKVPVEISTVVGSANFSSSSSYLTDLSGTCYVTVNPVLLGDLTIADDSPYAGENNAKVTRDITFDIAGAQLPQITAAASGINTNGAPERGYPIVGVDLDTLRITVNISGDISQYQYSDPEISAVSGSMGYRVSIDYSVLWYNQQVTIDILVKDDDSDVVTLSYRFETKDDNDEPVVSLITTENAISVNSIFVIDVYDAESGVSIDSISLAVNSGGTPYTLTVTSENYSGRSYRVTIDPTNPAILYGGDVVQLDVTVDDVLNNQETIQFSFTVDKEIISSATDHDPAPGSSINWDEIKSIYMKIPKPLPSMAGRTFDSFTVQFKDTTYVTGDTELTITENIGDYELRVSDDFGFTLTGQGGIQALADAMAAKEYLVTVDAIDTDGKNIGQYVYSFNILFGVDVDSLDIQKTLSCPTVFNALSGETTDLLYTLNEDKDTILRIYDLRGYRLYQRSFTAGEMGAKSGNNGVTWDGMDDKGDVVANGIYIFYVVSSKGNIITKGKVVVSNR